MVNVTIHDLPAASIVDNADEFPIMQGATVTRRATGTQVVAMVTDSLSTVATTGSAADLASGTLAVARMPALTGGDATSSAGSGALTLVANAVTNAKAAQMATLTLKGNNTGSTANAADLTVAQVTTMLGGPFEALGKVAGINTQTASYTLALDDIGKCVELNVATANTLTIPPNSSVAIPVGSYSNAAQIGAGQTTITPGSGVTLRSKNGLKISGQYATATLYKRATDEWIVSGDTAA